MYAILTLLGPYLATAVLLALLTIPPKGALPRAFQWLVGGENAPTTSVSAHYSREASRTSAMSVLVAAFAAEVFLILRADMLGAVHGRWEHVRRSTHTVARQCTPRAAYPLSRADPAGLCTQVASAASRSRHSCASGPFGDCGTL